MLELTDQCVTDISYILLTEANRQARFPHSPACTERALTRRRQETFNAASAIHGATNSNKRPAT